MDAETPARQAAETTPPSGASSFADVMVTRPDSTPPLPGAPRSEAVVLGIALALGIACDALTSREFGAGIGDTLSLLLGLVALVALSGRMGLRLESTARWTFVGALALLALVPSVRASEDLIAINAFAMFVAAVLLAVRVTGRRLPEIRVGEFLLACAIVPVLSAVRLVQAAVRVLGPSGAVAEGDAGSSDRFGGHGRDVLIGVLIAIPILGVFVALLAAADAGFARLLRELVDWDVANAALHVATVLLAALGFGAFLVAALASTDVESLEERRTHWAGPAVVWIVLGSTALLFASFALLQASYLFGGADYLNRTSGLTAAEYGRRGFFELVTVAALVVPLILVFRRWHADTPGAARAYRITAPVLAALTIVLQGSALSRMWIYQDRFGLSEQRLYATVILVWLALGLAWLGYRIARSVQPELATFAAVTGILLVLALDVVNPARLIAAANISAGDDRAVDVSYLSQLGPDAVPTIVDRIDELSGAEERDIATSLLAARDDAGDDDWRGANLSRSRATDAIDDERTKLERLAG